MKLRFTGSWARMRTSEREALTARASTTNARVVRAARRIVESVRTDGDAALRRLAARFDGVRLDALEVPMRLAHQALDGLDPALRMAMERSARNIAAVHRAFMPQPARAEPEPGIIVERRPEPYARVGVYAPGGRAAYASTVLMTLVPARVAGVDEVIVASPPGRSGLPAAPVLAAAALAGADRVFAIGGAGAIAAMAFGTASVPRVDRIVGPGNAYVTAAKVLVAGDVAIDCPAGPSELLVIADRTSDFTLVAGEMVAQAEHDPMTRVVALVLDGRGRELRAVLNSAARHTPRADVVRAALSANGGVIDVADMAEAIAIATAYAPEHLLIAVDCAESLAPRIRNAGSVFVGTPSSVVFGDYSTGANHVLPTGGSGRGYSGLATSDFVRWTTYQRVTPDAARALARSTETFAHAEQLPAHAAAAAQWSAT